MMVHQLLPSHPVLLFSRVTSVFADALDISHIKGLQWQEPETKCLVQCLSEEASDLDSMMATLFFKFRISLS